MASIRKVIGVLDMVFFFVDTVFFFNLKCFVFYLYNLNRCINNTEKKLLNKVDYTQISKKEFIRVKNSRVPTARQFSPASVQCYFPHPVFNGMEGRNHTCSSVYLHLKNDLYKSQHVFLSSLDKFSSFTLIMNNVRNLNFKFLIISEISTIIESL